MRNDVPVTIDEPPAAGPVPAPPLLLLSSDDDAVCTDELWLPAEALAPAEDPA